MGEHGPGAQIGGNLATNDQPYRSASVTEFWRRWHMTLSRWFRDYLYIPLGGNRHGTLRTFANLLDRVLSLRPVARRWPDLHSLGPLSRFAADRERICGMSAGAGGLTGPGRDRA